MFSLNPLKRVKFISIQIQALSLSFFLMVKVSIPSNGSSLFQSYSIGINPLPQLVSIPSNGSSLFQSISDKFCGHCGSKFWSQSPQTGQVYFNNPRADINSIVQCYVSIPSNGSSLFQWSTDTTEGKIKEIRLNPLKRVKFISIWSGWWNVYGSWRQIVSIPSNGSSLFQ